MECRIRKDSDADIDEMETDQASDEEKNRKRKAEEMDSKSSEEEQSELENLLPKNGDDENEIELSSDFDQLTLMSDDEDEPVDNQGNVVTIEFIESGLPLIHARMGGGWVQGNDFVCRCPPPHTYILSAYVHLLKTL